MFILSNFKLNKKCFGVILQQSIISVESSLQTVFKVKMKFCKSLTLLPVMYCIICKDNLKIQSKFRV